MLRTYYDNLKRDDYVPRDAEVNYAHAARQAYIALGSVVARCWQNRVDSTPMEGSTLPKSTDLGLPERGLRSVVLLPLDIIDQQGTGCFDEDACVACAVTSPID
jgi:hypothetical protein